MTFGAQLMKLGPVSILRSIIFLLCIAASQSANFTVARLVKTFGSSGGSRINSVNFSPDGSRVATGDANGNLNMWAVAGDPSTWGLLKTVGITSTKFSSVNFSPDGSRVATGDNLGYLNLWHVGVNLSTWGLLRTVGASGLVEIHSVNFSPDGSRVVTGDDNGNLDIWQVGGDPSTWGLLKKVGISDSALKSVNFSPDGTRVVTGDSSGNLTMWAVAGDPSTWGLLKTVGNSGSPINSVNFSPDGSMVATGDTGNLNVWQVGGDPSTWGLLKTVGTSSSGFNSVNFSPMGSRIVSGGNGNLDLWEVRGDPSAWGLLQTSGTSGFDILSVNFAPDGFRVVTGEDQGSLKLWSMGGDLSSSGLLKTVGNSGASINSVKFSPNGSRVVTGDANGNLTMWVAGGDPSTWGLLKTVGTSGAPINCVSFSPDGSRVITGDDQGDLDLWTVGGDPATWGLLQTFQSTLSFSSVDFSPDGSRVVTGDSYGYLMMWQVGGNQSTWGMLRVVGTTIVKIYSVDFSPDGSRVATGDDNGNLNVWQVGGALSTWGLIKTVGTSNSAFTSVTFSPSGTTLVAGDGNGNITLWAVQGNQSTWGLLSVVGSSSSQINSVSFSQDGSRLVTGDANGNLILWQVGGAPSTRGLLKTVGGSNSGFTSVNFSPDGSRVVTGDHNGNLDQWAVAGDGGSTKSSIMYQLAGSSPSTWSAPLVALLTVVNQYPAMLQQFTDMVSCGTELYGGGLYEVCNVTITQPSSSYLRRNKMPEVEELLSEYLPALRLNFAAAPMEGSMTPEDLPVAWRTLSLVLRDTFLQCSASGLFEALSQFSPFLKELDISSTLVTGGIENGSLPLLRKLQAANTPITNVSADYFQAFVQLLDLRNTSFLEAAAASLNTDTLVFRYGAPACSEPFPGHVMDGILCKLCEQGWYFDGRPSSQQCIPCLSRSGVAELELAGAVLLGLLLLFGLVCCALRARIQQLGSSAADLYPKLEFLEKKVKLTIFAYQQLSQLGYLARPLPPKTETLASAANIFNFQWLSNSAFAVCVLGLDYHAVWVLCLMEVAFLLVMALLLGHALGVSKLESSILAHSLTILAVASKTLPLFDCDDRLTSANLPLMANITKPYLKVDYNIVCSHQQHIMYEHLGLLVLVTYCFLIPGLQTLVLCRARSVINPPSHGQPLAHLAPERYLDLAREEFRRLDGAQLYPSSSLNQVQIAEAAAIRVRDEILQQNERFKSEVYMVSDLVPSMWWWFSVPTLSRVLLAGIYACEAQDQAFLGCALNMLYALAVQHFRPHLRQSDNQHDMLCQAAVGLAFALNSVQPATRLWLTVIVGALICLPGLSLCYHIGQHFNPSYKSRRLVDELVVPAMSQEEGRDAAAQRSLPCTGELRTLSGVQNYAGALDSSESI